MIATIALRQPSWASTPGGERGGPSRAPRCRCRLPFSKGAGAAVNQCPAARNATGRRGGTPAAPEETGAAGGNGQGERREEPRPAAQPLTAAGRDRQTTNARRS